MESVDKWMGKRGLSKNLRMRIGQHYQEVRLNSHPTCLNALNASGKMLLQDRCRLFACATTCLS